MKNLKRLICFIFAFFAVMVTFCMASFAADIQYTENVIPKMTSDTTPSGKASASSTWDNTYHLAWKAFNHSTLINVDAWSTKSGMRTGWLEYDFYDAKCISKYTLVSRNNEYYLRDELPRDWTFESWDENLNKWIVLDTRKNITDWQVGVKKEFTFTNKSQYKKYRINITANVGVVDRIVIGEMEMMEVVKTQAETPSNFKAIAGNEKVSLSWTAVTDAKTYNIKRSTTQGGQYTTIATGSAITYTDNTVKNGTTYYYVVSAVNEAGESKNSNEVAVTLVNLNVNLEVTSVAKAKVGEEIIVNVVIHNAKNICAEDIKLAFDTSKLEYISGEGADGVKIYKEDNLAVGIIRYITAHLGKVNAANGDKILLKLTFKAKAAGEAKIDITNGRIADNSTLEEDVKDENCGEKVIVIEPLTSDVNRSGQFTLLDLAIDAWYYGDKAVDTDTTKYDADVVKNGTIDDDDLTEIVNQMLDNSNYTAVAAK